MEAIEKIEFFKQRELSEIINATFTFLRQNFLKLGKCILFLVGPVVLLTALLAGFFQESLLEAQLNEDFVSLGQLYLAYFILAMISTGLLAAVVYEYISLYVEKELTEFDVSDVWNAAKNLLVKYIGASIVMGIVVFIGFMFCFVPGIYFAIAFSLTFVALVREKTGVFQAMSRSKELVSGYWWFTFGLIIIFVIIQIVLMLIFYVPQLVVSFIAGFHAAEGTAVTGSYNFLTIAASFIATIGYYLFYAIPLTGFAFHYHNLIERKEATGLIGEIDSIGE